MNLSGRNQGPLPRVGTPPASVSTAMAPFDGERE